MRFWIREVMGWLLVGMGLFVFYMCLVLLFNHYITEVGVVFIIGIIVFRGGIHLLKVAVAARICMLAQGKIEGGLSVTSKSPPRSRAFQPALAKAGMAREFRRMS